MNGSQVNRLKHPLPGAVIDRRGRGRRRRHHDRGRGIDRRGIDRGGIDWRRRHHNGRPDDAVHKRRRAESGSRNPPSAMMVVVMMVARTTVEPRTAMEPTMKPRTRTGEHHTCRCDGCQHYYQFLVHVFLLFLSLLTMGMARSPIKSDIIFKKNFASLSLKAASGMNRTAHIKASRARFRRSNVP